MHRTSLRRIAPNAARSDRLRRLRTRQWSLTESLCSPLCELVLPTTERRGNNLKGFKDLNLKAKARFWPWLPCM